MITADDHFITADDHFITADDHFITADDDCHVISPFLSVDIMTSWQKKQWNISLVQAQPPPPRVMILRTSKSQRY